MMTLMYKNIEDVRVRLWREGRRRRGAGQAGGAEGRAGGASVLAARVLVVRLLDVGEERRQRLQHHACNTHAHTITPTYTAAKFDVVASGV